MVIAAADTPRCSVEEWEHFRWMCSHGMLIEVMEWVEGGKPTLRPEEKKTSAFRTAIEKGNHSLVRYLWENCWQDNDEATRAVARAPDCGSVEVFRYLVQAGCPLEGVAGYDLFGSHDLGLIRAGLDRGVNLVGPDGYAAAFVRVPSRPLIRFYLEEHERRPELVTEGAEALSESIREGKIRAAALLVWAGVDPFTPLPDDDDPDEEPGCPAMEMFFAPEPARILGVLKLKPDARQWMRLMERCANMRPELADKVFALRSDGRNLIERDRALGTRILNGFVWNLTCPWIQGGSGRERREEIDERWCRELIGWDVPFLGGTKSDLGGVRRMIYGRGLSIRFCRVLEFAWNRGDDEQRELLRKFVGTPKMMGLVKDRAPLLHRLMGFEKERQPNRQRQVNQRGEGSKSTTRTTRSGMGGMPERRAIAETPPPIRCVPKGGKTLTREMIHSDIRAESAMKVAKRYGLLGSMLARICTLLEVPRPGRGYWARPEKARRKLFKALKPAGMGIAAEWIFDPSHRECQIVRAPVG